MLFSPYNALKMDNKLIRCQSVLVADLSLKNSAFDHGAKLTATRNEPDEYVSLKCQNCREI